MKHRRWLLAGLLLALLWAAPASAQNRIIVRTTLGQAGLLSLLQPLCLLQTCTVSPLGDNLGQLFLIDTSLNATTLLNTLLTLPGIIDAELDQLLSLIGGLNVVGTPPTALTDSAPVTYYGNTVWQGYTTQQAATIVRVSAAQTQFNVDGSGIIVADIDTGVDPNHPALAGVLAGQGTNLPSYDFTRNQAGASELNDVTPSDFPTYPPPPQQCPACSPATVNQSSAAILDQSSAAILDQNAKYAAFGHGTMVLGVIHLVAPKATLLPLKAFHSDGTGYLSDVLRAVYYAVKNGANVINMSFDFTSYSQELATALNYASQQTLICGASAGNEGQQIVVYPAGLQSAVMGVASTNNNDVRSSFSNYGTAVVWVAAPGEGIVTTYPFNTYAAGWGTSFSAPFVSGTSALVHNKQSTTNEAQAAAAVAHATPLSDPTLGHGRLDIVQSLQSISPADFSISTSPTTATITAGQVATYTATLTPINGFNQTITLSCGRLPSAATCTVTPPTVTLNGATPATATVTVQTTARAIATPAGFIWTSPFSGASAARFGWMVAWIAGLLVWASLCHLGLAKRPARGLAAALGLVTFSLALYSCGGNSSSSGSGPGTPGPASATLSSLTLTPTAVNGGVLSNGLVTLSAVAPSGGAVVSLSSSNPSVATVPASVTVAAGASSTAFQVATTSVSSQTTVTISASYSGSQQSATLTVVPASSALTLASLVLSPTTVNGGVPSNGLVTLSGTAPSGGAVVSLSSNNTSVATVPASVTVPSGASSAAFQVSTTTVSSQATATISGSYSGSQQSAVLTVIPATSAPTLTSLTVNPTSVNGGNSSTGTVTLSSAAPSGGVVVSLASSNTSLAPVPASVAIPAGATSATFGVKTSAVSSTTTVTITGSYAGVQQSALLTVTPAQSGPSLTSLILNPTSVTGGSQSTGTVALNGPAPAGGAVVSLSSSNSAVAVVPSSVTIAAATASATFAVTTVAVTSATTSTISASYNGVTQTNVLSVRPPGTPAGTYNFTVTGTAGTLSHSTSPTLVVN